VTSFLAPAQVALITRAGASLATIHASAAGPARQYAAGWVGGAGLNLPLDQVQVVSRQPEVLFNRKGFAMSGIRYVHNYLEVPLLLKVNLKRNGLQTFLAAGPSGGLLLSGTFRTNGAGAANRFTNRAFGLTLGYALPLAGG
jgi:hypothetical protein